MKIELAKNSGFCMGVRDALLRIVNEINTTDESIYVYGPLIHNPQTVEVLHKRGLQTINTLESIDDKIIAIRTHGIPFEKLRDIKKRAKRYINLTCSRVARVQGLIRKYSRNGYFTIIIGDKNHAEVIGLQSYASSGVIVVSQIDDVPHIPPADNYLVVSQTTFDTELFEALIGAIGERFSNVIVVNTICHSTHNRQDDVKQGIERGIDALVVVGGKNSANTKRLASIGDENNIVTYHVETESELKSRQFDNVQHVLVTAGASTPGWIINRVLERLYDIKYANSNFLINLLKKTAEFIVRTNLFSAITASFITLFAQRFLDRKPDFVLAFISFIYIFSMYTINNLFELDFLKVSNPYKFVLYRKYKNLLLPVSIISLLISSFIIRRYGTEATLIFLSSSLFGILYSAPWIRGIFYTMKSNLIKKLYFSKSIVVAGGWVIITTVIPLISDGDAIHEIVFLSFFIYTFIFLRSVLLDCIAFQGDLILGRETLPILLGVTCAKNLLLLASLSAIITFGSYAVILQKLPFLIFTVNIIYFSVLIVQVIKLNYLISLKYELLVDCNLLLFTFFYFVLSFIQ